MTTSKKGLRASNISYSPFGITISFQFTDHRQEMLDSCAHNEPGIASILRTNSDKRAQLRFSGNAKNAPAANSLEFGGIDPPLSNHGSQPSLSRRTSQPTAENKDQDTFRILSGLIRGASDQLVQSRKQ